jgi:hypothetical protein
MAQAKQMLGRVKARRAPGRRATRGRWVVAAVIAIYCLGLSAGLLLYEKLSAAAVPEQPAPTAKSRQIGKLIIVTPGGCQAGEFDNSHSSAINLSEQSCDAVLDSPDAGKPEFGNARIKEIGRYFRGDK